MLYRTAEPDDIPILLKEGYKEWSKNRTFEQYYIENIKEDAYGTRYVIEDKGELVSSLILLRLKEIKAKKVFGIGSVLTPKAYEGKGYASKLIKNCMEQAVSEDSFLFLFSDINPVFYERFGFRILPSSFQRYEKSICMVYCTDDLWNQLLRCSIDEIPSYF